MNTPSLTGTALLGTARMAELPPPSHPLLATPWSELAGQESARALLQAAALEKAALHAGAVPITDVATPEPCPEDRLPVAPPGAVQALARILNGDYARNLHEWLTAAIAARVLAPPRILPALLEKGSREKEFRPLIATVSGSRGPWLARRHERWGWALAAGQHDEDSFALDAWETGTTAERIAWLARERRRDPAEAAKTIGESWATESPESREAIAALVATTPDPADIAWLESLALAERRQAIRQSARQALIALPESDYHRRTVLRAGTLLEVRRKGLRKVITLQAPAAFDPLWHADGIKEKPPTGTGEKAWWSRQLIAAVPLDLWSGILGIDAPFSHALDSDWRETILLGWLDAARLPSRPDHLQALLELLVTEDLKKFTAPPDLSAVIREMVAPLPSPLQSDILEAIAPRLEKPTALALLANLQPAVRSRAHPRLHTLLRDGCRDTQSTLTRPDAAALASCIEPSAIPDFLLALSKISDLTASAEEFARTLEFRQTYLPHLTPRND